MAIGGHVIHAEGNEIAAAQLAVDGEIEQRQVTHALLKFQLRAYRPTWLQWRFLGILLTLVPGRSTRPRA
jgi:hypothetical protein